MDKRTYIAMMKIWWDILTFAGNSNSHYSIYENIYVCTWKCVLYMAYTAYGYMYVLCMFVHKISWPSSCLMMKLFFFTFRSSCVGRLALFSPGIHSHAKQMQQQKNGSVHKFWDWCFFLSFFFWMFDVAQFFFSFCLTRSTLFWQEAFFVGLCAYKQIANSDKQCHH